MMGYFKKKPVVIEAIQWTGENIDEILKFMKWGNADHDACSSLFINTLEGQMKAGKGDWIIKGVKGEFYPCRSDIFEARSRNPVFRQIENQKSRGPIMTTWPDVAIMFMVLLVIIGGIGIGAYLVTKGHPWFALLVFLMVASVSVKTGKAAECGCKNKIESINKAEGNNEERNKA